MTDAPYKLGNFVAGIFYNRETDSEKYIKDADGYTLYASDDIDEWRSVRDRLNIQEIWPSEIQIPKTKVREGVTHKLRGIKEGEPDRIVIEGALVEPITFTARTFSSGGKPFDLIYITFPAVWKVLIENNVLNIPLYYPNHDGLRWPKLHPTLGPLSGGTRTSRKRSYRRKTRTKKSRR